MAKTNPANADFNVIVADNIRAELARERWSGRKAAAALGLNPMYISRRLSGETPLDPNDLVMFARLLRVPVSAFFAETQKGPATEATGPYNEKAAWSGVQAASLPELDSNQQPAGVQFGLNSSPGDQLEHHRQAKVLAHKAVASSHVAPVTAIKKASNL